MTVEDPDAALRYGPLRRAVMRHPWGFGIAIGLLFFPVLRCMSTGEADPIPSLGSAPDFALEDHTGAEVNLGSLKGSVWVVHPYVVPCEGPCVATMSAARELRDRFQRHKRPVHILGWPSGPVSPGELRTLIDRHGVEGQRWRLLRGETREAPLSALQGSPLVAPSLTQLVVIGSDSQIRARLGIGSLGVEEAASLCGRLISEARLQAPQGAR